MSWTHFLFKYLGIEEREETHSDAMSVWNGSRARAHRLRGPRSAWQTEAGSSALSTLASKREYLKRNRMHWGGVVLGKCLSSTYCARVSEWLHVRTDVRQRETCGKVISWLRLYPWKRKTWNRISDVDACNGVELQLWSSLTSKHRCIRADTYARPHAHCLRFSKHTLEWCKSTLRLPPFPGNF